MHKYMALYSVVLFLVAIAAPMEQSNNAAMYAEVSQSDPPLPAFLSHRSCGILSDSCDRMHLVQQSLPFLPMQSIFCANFMTFMNDGGQDILELQFRAQGS